MRRHLDTESAPHSLAALLHHFHDLTKVTSTTTPSLILTRICRLHPSPGDFPAASTLFIEPLPSRLLEVNNTESLTVVVPPPAACAERCSEICHVENRPCCTQLVSELRC